MEIRTVIHLFIHSINICWSPGKCHTHPQGVGITGEDRQESQQLQCLGGEGRCYRAQRRGTHRSCVFLLLLISVLGLLALTPEPQSWCTCDREVPTVRGFSSLTIIYPSQTVLLINLVSTWIAFSSLIQNRHFQKEQEKTTDIPKPQGYMEIRKWHILSGFQAREKADEMGPWHPLHGGSQCPWQNLLWKNIWPEQSCQGAHTNQSWRRRRRSQTYKIRVGGGVTCSQHTGSNCLTATLSESIICLFFFLLHRLPSLLHKMSQTARLLFWECWIL